MISRTGITHGYPDYGSSLLIGLLLAPLLALLVSRDKKPFFEAGLQWVGPAIYAACLALFVWGSHSRLHASLIYIATPWLVLSLAYLSRGLPETSWLIQGASYLGLISYALYLFHYPIFFAVAKFSGADNFVGALLALLLGLIFAHVAEKQIQPQAVRCINHLRDRLGAHGFLRSAK
jgi:peptidoglycan/LPS O-acetylase OafA/YrhL